MTLSYRRFEVVKKVRENSSVVSLFLKPVDDAPLKEFKPGQHLMFKFQIPGREIPEFRYYSFSDKFQKHHYRVSIKKELPPAQLAGLPPGLCSSHICDEICEGMVLEAKGPSGDFYIVPQENFPVVFIAGGIGITPILSMIKSIAEVNPDREVYFFYGVNEKGDHSFQAELDELRNNHPNFSITTFYANVGKGDVKGLDYDYEGFIDIEKISRIVPHSNLDYYICGPAAMMNYVCEYLRRSGVPDEKIRTESFNDPYKNVTQGTDADLETHEKSSSPTHHAVMVDFIRSNKKLPWDNRYRSILEFAEAHDIEISSGCLFGDCGSCLTKVQEGNVKYIHDTTVIPGKGECLPCSSVPGGDLVLDA
jgi:ferredoxin-NADP reductase